MALAHRLFFFIFWLPHSTSAGDTERVMRQSDSNLKSCTVFSLRSFFTIFFPRGRGDFFCLLLKMREPRNSCVRTKKRKGSCCREIDYIILCVHVLDRVLRLRHRSISIRLWPSLVIISILLCDIFVFCEFCSLMLCAGLLLLYAWMPVRSLLSVISRKTIEMEIFWVPPLRLCSMCRNWSPVYVTTTLPSICRFIFMTNISVYFS